MGSHWGRSALGLAKSMTDIEYYEAILRNVFDGFYPGYWKRESRVELFKKFLRHYALSIKGYTLKELKRIDIKMLIACAKLEGSCDSYFGSKYGLMFLKTFPEISVFELSRFPKNFWNDEVNIRYVIQHLIEVKYELNASEVCKKFTTEFLNSVGLGSLRNFGYTTYDLLELAYPGKYKLHDLIIGRRYPNVNTKLLNTSKKLVMICHILGIDLKYCPLDLIRSNFNKFGNEINNLSGKHNISFAELKEKAIELEKSGKFTEEDLNLISEEEKEEIKKKYAEYLKEKHNQQN